MPWATPFCCDLLALNRAAQEFSPVGSCKKVTLGSDLAAIRLGESFLRGDDGLPKDPARARYWLKKVVDGECEIGQIADAAKAHVAKLLEELDAIV